MLNIELAAFRLNNEQIYLFGQAPQTSTANNALIEFVTPEGDSVGSQIIKANNDVYEFSIVLDNADPTLSSLSARLTIEEGVAIGESSVTALVSGPDSDSDGIIDAIEKLASNNGDGNEDGSDDWLQSSVASLPDAKNGHFVTIVSAEHSLQNVRPVSAVENTLASRRLPFGLIGFDIQGVAAGTVASAELILPPGTHASRYYKPDADGQLAPFDFNGQTGAVLSGNRVTLYLQDGGRGDADGIANGIVRDPGAPESGVILVGPGVTTPLEGWDWIQSGGTGDSEGTVVGVAGDLVLTEGNSFLVEARRSITIPSNPSALEFEYFGAFDTTDTGFINDAFEVALVDSTGRSIVPTYLRNRDSYFNFTEEESPSLGSLVDHEPDSPSSGVSGVVQLDISDLLPGSTATVVMRLVNNDQDQGTTFGLKQTAASLIIDPVTGNEGEATSLSAVLPGVTTTSGYSAQIDWGDGTTSSGTLSLDGTNLVIGGEHTYADNADPSESSYAVTVTLSHNSELFLTGATVATIANVAPSTTQPSNQTATAETSKTFTLGTFTDPGFSFGSSSETFSAIVDWGDGTSIQSITPTVTNGSVGTATTGGLPATSHTFSTTGTYTVTVTVNDDDGGSATSSFDVTVSAPAIAIDAITANEGSSVSLSAAASGLPPSLSYTADIVWGDGTTTTDVQTTVSGSDVLISSNHTYADNKSGNYAVSVTLKQASTVVATGATIATIANVAPTKSQPSNQTAIVGSSKTFPLGSFTDPGFTFNLTSETFTASVDWGDGTSAQSITPSSTNGSPGTATNGSLPDTSHTFGAAGTYTVTVSVTDDDGGTDSKTFDVVVSTASVNVSAISGNEGASVTLNGSVAGLNTSQTYTADISWGDGTITTGAATTVSGDDVLVSSSHTYADNKNGNYAVNVTFKQSSTVVATGSTVSTIGNIVPTKTQPNNQAATAGTSQTFSLGTFTDPGFTFGPTTESFTATIDWGDGSETQVVTPSVTNGSVGTATSGTLPDTQHAYSVAGTYTVTVSVVDDDGGSASKMFDVVVSAPTIDLAAVSGNEGSSVSLTGSAAGLDTSLTYTADITWGDGTTSNDVSTSVSGNDILISANHAYADDISGDHAIAVVLKQGAQTVSTGATTADIANVSPELAFVQDIAINTELQPSGQERTVSFTSDFTDLGILDTHTYHIDWGDGSSSSGSLTTDSGSGEVSGTRSYAINGTYQVTVTVTDDDGGSAQRQFRVYIAGDVITVTEDSYVELDLSGLEVDAGYNNELGMFIVEDVHGTIRDSNGTPLLPDDPGYALAAIGHSSRRVILHRDYMAETKNMSGASRQQHNYRVMVEAGSFVSFYAIQNQTTDWWLANNPNNTISTSNYKNLAFFTAREANPDDGHTHFRVTTLPDGSIRYGHEDLIRGSYGVSGQNSDEDYNDLNFTIRVTPISQSQSAKFFVDNNASTDDRIFFYNSEGNSVQSELAPNVGNTQSIGLASDYTGSRLWSIDKNKSIYDYPYNSGPHTFGSPSVWNPRTGSGGTLNEPTDIATDSQHIWVVDKNGTSSKVYFYSGAATSAPSGNTSATSSFTLNSSNANPSGLAVDSTRVFVTDLTSREVFVYQRANGNYIGRWKLDPGNRTPTDITTEPTGLNTFGTDLFVVDKTRGEVFAYPDSTGWVNNGNSNSTTFVSKNSTWKYSVASSEPASDWNSISFDDGAWGSGQATLGYGGGQTTTIGYGGNSSDKNNTTYFRKEFQVSGSDYTGLMLSLRRDDGAVVYLNGVEVARHNMPFGEIDYNTKANSNINESNANYHGIKISPKNLVIGTNVLAIEIHKFANSGSASNKLLMDAELKSYVAPFRIASTTFSLQLEKQSNGDTLSQNTFPEGIADPPPTATVTWTGGASGSWHTAGNWSTSTVPSISDNVLIPTGNQVNITGAVNVNSIQGDGTVALTNWSSHLTLANESEIGGLNISSGILEGAANVTVTDTFAWTAGRIDGSGILYVASGATGTLSSTSEKVLDREMRNSGSLTWSDGTWKLDDDSTDPYGGGSGGGSGSGSGSGGLGDDAGIIKFVNEASGTLTISGSGSYRNWSSGAASSYDPETWESVVSHPPLIENLGTITQTFTGTLSVAPSFDNDDTANIQSGKMQLDGAGSSEGDFVVSSGATVQFDPSGQSGSSATQYLSSAATISGSGTAV
ncbi:metallophosphoesterase, partial [Rhodopirellula maiorica SM1]